MIWSHASGTVAVAGSTQIAAARAILRCAASASALMLAGGIMRGAPALAAQTAPAPPPEAGWVVVPRYATAGEAALFAGRVAPHWVVAEELTYDVHSKDWSLAVGTGPQFHLGGSRVIAIVGPVTASGTTWYAGVYLAPTIPLWRLTASGTIELFFPVAGGARFEYEVSHARLLTAATQRLQAGAFFHMVKTLGSPTRAELGPSLRLGVSPELQFTVDGARGFGSTPSEIVFTVQWEP